MRFKPVPPAPASLETARAVREAVPIVPKPESDCCARIVDRTTVADEDEARAWLTLLRALGAVDRHDRYVRSDEPPDADAMGERFLENILLAEPVLDGLSATEPRDSDAVFESVRDGVPAWERRRLPDWEAHHRDRIGRILEWLALLGLARRTSDGYVRADTE